MRFNTKYFRTADEVEKHALLDALFAAREQKLKSDRRADQILRPPFTTNYKRNKPVTILEMLT